VSQYGRPSAVPQFASLVHWTQACVVVLHAGRRASVAQFPSARHCTQMLSTVSQYGVGAAQSPVPEHLRTQAWVAVLQARFGSPQFALVRHATQRPVPVSQYGASPPGQSVLVRHSAQAWVVVLHTGLRGSEQFAFPTHSTQMPDAQYGAGGAQSPDPAQALAAVPPAPLMPPELLAELSEPPQAEAASTAPAIIGMANQ